MVYIAGMSLQGCTESLNEYRFADIVVPLNLPNLLTYGIPQQLQSVVKEGMRVEVALGKNKHYSGVILRLHNERPEAYQVKPIKRLIDQTPIINATQILFWKWIMQYYMATPGEVMLSALPAHLKLSGETRIVWREEAYEDLDWSDATLMVIETLALKKEITISELKALTGAQALSQVLTELIENEVVWIKDYLEESYQQKKETVVSLHPQYQSPQQLNALFETFKRAPKQEALLLAFIELAAKTPIVKQSELLTRAMATTAQVKALQEKDIFILSQIIVDRIQPPDPKELRSIQLSQAQQQAMEALQQGLAQKNVVLIDGVTGSGKTLLYIQKIRETIAAGKQALFLLPEIALTTQLVSRLYAYFGKDLGVYHSRFSNNERVEIWERVKKKQFNIIVGPRSAIWLPFDNLGLIIVDEEHDASYKQKDPAPRFHARDAAIYLATLHQAKVILGSATPSVESIYNARQHKYGYVPLQERYQGVRLPQIEIINAKSIGQLQSRNIKLLTPELIQEITKALQQQKQVILFQNRRGYAPFQICTFCGWVPHCKNCAVSLSYHKSSDKLQCHYCGAKNNVINNCPSCGSHRIQSKTFGTERIEEEVQLLFPKARIARMDVDSMRGKNTMTQLLERLEKQKIDILIGTQMVVKGLDFAHIALVGIIHADSLLSFPDFRVNERAYQLMEQVSGRAGRADGDGKVLIQAYNATHPILKIVQQHQPDIFYQNELEYRATFHYPPYSRILKIICKHTDEAKCIQAATAMSDGLNRFDALLVQGPVSALVSKVRNQYIQEIWLRFPKDWKLVHSLKAFLLQKRQEVLGKRGWSNAHIIFDVDTV